MRWAAHARGGERPPWKVLARGAVVLAVVLGGCSVSVPSATSVDFARDAGEEYLWREAVRFEKYLRQNDLVYRAPNLDAYLAEMVAVLSPHFGVADGTIRVHVVATPFANAFALPNGGVYFNSGLLAHVENESQLALLLAHEISHFVGRHAYLQRRSHENRVAAVTAASAAVSLTTAGIGAILVAAAPEILARQYYGYSRELERWADARGLHAMAGAGFDATQAPRLYELLKLEDEGEFEEFCKFGSHPTLDERIASAREILAEGEFPEVRVDREPGSVVRYERAISGLLLDNALLDLRYKRYRRATAAVDRHLASLPSSARGRFVRGEIARKIGKPTQAILAYEECIAIDPEYADAYREIGLLHRAGGRPVAARAALRRYLALSDDEIDRAIVQGFLADVEAQPGP